MPEGNSLINLGDLSKPATVLVEKVSNAVGVLYEPRRIRKKAEAEAQAEKIKALSSLELSEIQQRGIDRLVQQEGRRQENIESITAQAASSLGDDAEVENLEEDWIAHFFKQCDSVSDKEMQSLWSRLLSGEATKAGAFSKRTVDVVASMDKNEAKMFTDFCQYCWFSGGITPLIFDEKKDVYNEGGIDLSALNHLHSIGLISFNPMSGYKLNVTGRGLDILYFGTPVSIIFDKEKDNNIQLGKALLTQAGEQLAPICGAQKNESFYNYVIEKWYEDGVVLSTPIN